MPVHSISEINMTAKEILNSIWHDSKLGTNERFSYFNLKEKLHEISPNELIRLTTIDYPKTYFEKLMIISLPVWQNLSWEDWLGIVDKLQEEFQPSLTLIKFFGSYLKIDAAKEIIKKGWNQGPEMTKVLRLIKNGISDLSPGQKREIERLVPTGSGLEAITQRLIQEGAVPIRLKEVKSIPLFPPPQT